MKATPGLTASPGKTVYQKWYRGFESLLFRNLKIEGIRRVF